MQLKISINQHQIRWSFKWLELVKFIGLLSVYRLIMTIIYLFYRQITNQYLMIFHNNLFWLFSNILAGGIAAFLACRHSLRFVGWHWCGRTTEYFGELVTYGILTFISWSVDLCYVFPWPFQLLEYVYLEKIQMASMVFYPIEAVLCYIWDAPVFFVLFIVGYLLIRHLFDGSTQLLITFPGLKE